MNLRYRGIDKPTDVLSFPQNDEFCKFKQHDYPIPLGDIVINTYQAERQAKEHKFGLHHEINWLLIHGLLHLLGYDHEKNKYQATKMRRLERELLKSIT